MLFKLAWRNIWRNKKRSIITIVSITIAVVLSVFMRSMQLGMYDNMISNVVGSYSGYLQIHSNGYWEEQSINNAFETNDELETSINANPDVVNIIPRLQVFALASSGELTKGVLVQGVIPDKEQLLVDWKGRLIKGELFHENDESIILAKDVAGFFKLDVGDTLILIGQGYQGMSAAGKFGVAGIVDMKNPKINSLSVFLPINTARNFVSGENLITHFIVDKDENSDEMILEKELKTSLDTTAFEVMTWKEMLPELEQTIMADSVGGLLMVFILYMIITFGIFGTVLMMTQERIYEIGVMMAIGMKKVKIIATMTIESILLTVLGILSGMCVVLPLVYYFNSHPIELGAEQAEAIEKFGFESVIPTLTDFDIFMTHGLIVFCISLVIAFYPAITVWRLDALKAMRR